MSDSTISIQNVKHVAKLANLTITEEQALQFQTQLSAIVDYFKTLDEVNVDNIIPTAQVTGLENITRKDQIGDRTLTQDQALTMSPHKHKGYIQVPSILTDKAEE